MTTLTPTPLDRETLRQLVEAIASLGLVVMSVSDRTIVVQVPTPDELRRTSRLYDGGL